MGGVEMIYCPYCHSTMVGRVGVNQYYCRNCYYEFKESKHGIKAYQLNEDGALEEIGLIGVGGTI